MSRLPDTATLGFDLKVVKALVAVFRDRPAILFQELQALGFEGPDQRGLYKVVFVHNEYVLKLSRYYLGEGLDRNGDTLTQYDPTTDEECASYRQLPARVRRRVAKCWRVMRGVSVQERWSPRLTSYDEFSDWACTVPEDSPIHELCDMHHWNIGFRGDDWRIIDFAT